MRLWTFQPIEVHDILTSKGIFTCDPSKSTMIEFDGFVKAYEWLTNQMTKRIGSPPAGVSFPIWAWHTTYWKQQKPDLRRSEFRNYSKSMVCLEIEKTDTGVLLSDEENWHLVLNDSYIADSEEDFDTFYAHPSKAKKESSWEKIFDISPYEDKWFRKGMFVQATFWELNLSEVVKVIPVNNKVDF